MRIANSLSMLGTTATVDQTLPTEKLLLVIFAAAALFWAALIDWAAPITELHDFRQAQTAISSYWMARDGVSFWRAPMPVFGDASVSIPLEFPIYQGLVAYTSQALQLQSPQDIVLIGRVVSFFCFFLSGYALFRLVRLVHGPRVALIAASLFVMLPYPVVWASSVLIEYAELAAAIFYLEAVWRVMMLGDRRWSTLLAGMAAGIAAMLIKITTVLVYGPAIGMLWVLWIARCRGRQGLGGVARATILLAVVPLALGLAWTVWGDAVKAQSPLTSFLTSANNARWNYGTLAQRLDLGVWGRIGGFWSLQILAIAGIPFFIAGFRKAWKQDKLVLTFWCSVPVIAVLAFVNLYQRHNYYSIALLPCFLAVTALGICMASTSPMFASRGRHAAAAITGAVILAAWGSIAVEAKVLDFAPAQRFLEPYRGMDIAPSVIRQRDLLLADIMRRQSRRDEVVLILNGDWKPLAPFLAERVAFMPHGCAADLVMPNAPHFELVLLDRGSNLCPELSIPRACLLETRNGIDVGRCVETRSGRRIGNSR